MGWEERRGRSYFYRKERDGNRVRSVYVGAGEVVGLMGQLEELRHEEAEHQRASARRERERQREDDAVIDKACAFIEALARGTLVAAGYHQHKGQWRRKRG